MKACSKCGVEKEFGEFRLCKYPNGKEYIKAMCRECEREGTREYISTRREEMRLKSREFQKNKPEYKRQWREDNRDKLNREYREKCADDPTFRLRKNFSRSISRALKKYGGSKDGASSLDAVQYSFEELVAHIESQFELWMNWNNYGAYNPKTWDDKDPTTWKWQLDHIKPHSEFLYSSMEIEAFRECWDLSNLRPYSAKQNIIDGATRIRHNINNDA